MTINILKLLRTLVCCGIIITESDERQLEQAQEDDERTPLCVSSCKPSLYQTHSHRQSRHHARSLCIVAPLTFFNCDRPRDLTIIGCRLQPSFIGQPEREPRPQSRRMFHRRDILSLNPSSGAEERRQYPFFTPSVPLSVPPLTSVFTIDNTRDRTTITLPPPAQDVDTGIMSEGDADGGPTARPSHPIYKPVKPKPKPT